MEPVRRRLLWGIATAAVVGFLAVPGISDRIIDVIRSAYLVMLLEAQAFALMCS